MSNATQSRVGSEIPQGRAEKKKNKDKDMYRGILGVG